MGTMVQVSISAAEETIEQVAILFSISRDSENYLLL